MPDSKPTKKALSKSRFPPAPGSLNIRSARKTDIPHLVALIKDAFAEYNLMMDPAIEVPDFLSFENSYDFRKKHLLTALWNDKIAGCGAVTIDGKVAWLSRIYVHTGFRKRGIGTGIMQRLTEIALESGTETIELWSDTRFTDAHRLYRRFGFTQSGRERILQDDPNDTVEYHFFRNL
ncbi:MAG: GNAT family N-acetyltransferase [Cyclonatronaceae bacterium]